MFVSVTIRRFGSHSIYYNKKEFLTVLDNCFIRYYTDPDVLIQCVMK